MSKRVVVIGGSAAGMSAASVAKRRDPDLMVTVFEQGHAISYSACGMPYRLGGQIERAMKDLVVLTPKDARNKGVDVRTRTRVTRVDAKAQKVWWEELDGGKDGEQREEGAQREAEREKGEEEYDELVLATGARAREAVPVSPAHGVFTLRSLDDGVSLERWLDQKKKEGPVKAVVVGAGFIGVEVSEGLLERGLDVTLVNRDRHVLSSMLDEELAELVAGRLESSGVRFVTGKTVTGWVAADGTVHQVKEAQLERAPEGMGEPSTERKHVAKAVKNAAKKVAASSRRSPSSQDPGSQSQSEFPRVDEGVQAVLLDGKPQPADVVVVSTGVVADGTLAKQAGCRVREDGSVAVDDRMRTGVEGVWACGDCVAFPHRLLEEPIFLPLALHANRSGRIVGMNLTGSDKRFPGVLGTTITRFGDLEMASTGITKTMAGRAGLDVVVGDAQSMTQAGYMPGDHEVTVRMVAERATGRLLGVQMVGARGTALRVDAAVAMVWKGATLEEVEEMDLAYNPPFSPVWDPLAIAARLTERERAPRGR